MANPIQRLFRSQQPLASHVVSIRRFFPDGTHYTEVRFGTASEIAPAIAFVQAALLDGKITHYEVSKD